MNNQKIFRIALLKTAVLLLLTCTVGFAKPVSVDIAKQIAKNFMMQQTGITYDISKDSISFQLKGGGESETPAYYVFNMAPEGWIIVAGDDIAYPVIGYSRQGSVNSDDVSPAFSEWMIEIEKQIIQAAKEEPEPLASIKSTWEKFNVADYKVYEVMVEAVEPLLKTTWSQGKYYNNKCPVDSNGIDGHALVGCSATAVGQIMKYHNWPPKGSGSHTYSHQRYGTLSANFGATNYSWKSIPSTGKLTSYNDALATLLYHVGVSFDMDYDPRGSVSKISKIAPALFLYFKYKPTNYSSRSYYFDSAWLAKIKNDLNAKRPIIYVGGGRLGHAFVCDGYRTDFFHFNWGWNGGYDGYFYINNLTPAYYNFTYGQKAIFGIEPNKPQKIRSLAGLQFLLLNGKTTPRPPSCPSIPNGGFENGVSSWKEYSISNSWIIAQWGIAHSGSWSAGLCDTISHIQQQVTVPSSCPYLVFYHWIDSFLECGNHYGFVRINGMNVKTIQLCSNNNTNGWVRQVVDLSDYANQSVTLQFRSEMEFILNWSYWYIDDVSFKP
ncbi:MAG: C10 family peptidase [Thermodesulfobacteriota bacterium]|nr:C10 family peptidase [Thermodesulfobacteriota bacterium]